MWKFGETCVLELGHGNCHKLLVCAINKELGGAKRNKTSGKCQAAQGAARLGQFYFSIAKSEIWK